MRASTPIRLAGSKCVGRAGIASRVEDEEDEDDDEAEEEEEESLSLSLSLSLRCAPADARVLLFAPRCSLCSLELFAFYFHFPWRMHYFADVSAA